VVFPPETIVYLLVSVGNTTRDKSRWEHHRGLNEHTHHVTSYIFLQSSTQPFISFFLLSSLRYALLVNGRGGPAGRDTAVAGRSAAGRKRARRPAGAGARAAGQKLERARRPDGSASGRGRRERVRWPGARGRRCWGQRCEGAEGRGSGGAEGRTRPGGLLRLELGARSEVKICMIFSIFCVVNLVCVCEFGHVCVMILLCE
jgi:hypothetical protein